MLTERLNSNELQADNEAWGTVLHREGGDEGAPFVPGSHLEIRLARDDAAWPQPYQRLNDTLTDTWQAGTADAPGVHGPEAWLGEVRRVLTAHGYELLEETNASTYEYADDDGLGVYSTSIVVADQVAGP